MRSTKCKSTNFSLVAMNGKKIESWVTKADDKRGCTRYFAGFVEGRREVTGDVIISSTRRNSRAVGGQRLLKSEFLVSQMLDLHE